LKRFYAVHNSWQSKFVLNDDGTFIGGGNKTGNGKWRYVKDDVLLLEWYHWTSQYLTRDDLGNYHGHQLILRPIKDYKVFCVGMHRTGTRSLCKALDILGYPSMHYRKNRNKFNKMKRGRFNCFNNDGIVCSYADVPIPYFYKELYEYYPDSKFILNIREEESWLRSIKRHLSMLPDFNRRELDREIHKYFYGVDIETPVDDELYLEKYNEHNRNVKEFFKDSNNFLIYNVVKENSWDILCEFLGEDIPNKPFPHKGK
jgi:hypothetical protein